MNDSIESVVENDDCVCDFDLQFAEDDNEHTPWFLEYQAI